jgi:hypothetical protein
MHWAAIVHEETWNTEVPDLPYVAATASELEVVSVILILHLHVC